MYHDSRFWSAASFLYFAMVRSSTWPVNSLASERTSKRVRTMVQSKTKEMKRERSMPRMKQTLVDIQWLRLMAIDKRIDQQTAVQDLARNGGLAGICAREMSL